MPTNDSGTPDSPDVEGGRDRDRRIAAVKRWVAYIREQPPETWGAQQNRLVNEQLESARESGLDAEHRQRVERAGRDD